MSNPVMFKNQLQEYTQKHSLSAPIYEHVKEGPSHKPNFTATVIVNGIRYDSPTAFRNRKTAEHAAAQVALQELGKAANGAGGIPNPVFESGLCKNLLQEYAQKLNLPVPSYCCKKSGEGHTDIFISTVEIAGISYVGGPAKNKKTAEIKAARTALSEIETKYSKKRKSEDQEMVVSAGEEVKQLGVVMVDALGESEQRNQGDIITNGLGKNEQDKQEVDHEIYKLPSNKEEKKNGTPDFPGSDEQNKQLSNQGIEKLPVEKEVQKLKEEHEEHGTQEEISPLE